MQSRKDEEMQSRKDEEMQRDAKTQALLGF